MSQCKVRVSGEVWFEMAAMFMVAFSLIVMSAATQIGGLIGNLGVLIAGANIAYVIWETLLKDAWQRRRSLHIRNKLGTVAVFVFTGSMITFTLLLIANQRALLTNPFFLIGSISLVASFVTPLIGYVNWQKTKHDASVRSMFQNTTPCCKT